MGIQILFWLILNSQLPKINIQGNRSWDLWEHYIHHAKTPIEITGLRVGIIFHWYSISKVLTRKVRFKNISSGVGYENHDKGRLFVNGS